MKLISLVFVLIFGTLILVVENINAQERIEISVFPGFHVVNSDKISADSNVSQTNWVFGGSISTRFEINKLSLAYSISYAYGKSDIFFPTLTDQTGREIDSNFSVSLRYRSIPQELYWVNHLTDNIDLLTGINLTAQDRTVQYANLDIEDDRLFSLGIGLSGKLHMIISRFSSGNGQIFLNMSVRWTEFIYHDRNNRVLDNFTLRHVTLSPKLGVSCSFY